MHCSWMKSRITAAGKARRQQEYVEHNSDSRMTTRNYSASLSSRHPRCICLLHHGALDIDDEAVVHIRLEHALDRLVHIARGALLDLQAVRQWLAV